MQVLRENGSATYQVVLFPEILQVRLHLYRDARGMVSYQGMRERVCRTAYRAFGTRGQIMYKLYDVRAPSMEDL